MAKQRLFILSPAVVFTARINQASFTYPLSSVEFDNVGTGAFGDILPGMTVLFGSTAGSDDKGRNRIRAAADSNTIFIGRSSQGIRDGEVDLDDNDHITVLNDFRMWSKIPDISDAGAIVKDEIAYTDQTDEIPPKANIIGGAAAASISGGVITVAFDGTDSYAVASGATIGTYLWDVDDGTITVGTSASSGITATFPVGFRWVSLTVTDSNGKTHTTRIPVYARSAAADTTIPFHCVEHRITQQGQFCSFRVLADIAASSYPDGTLVIFFEGEPASSSDRSNVLFWGWHQNNSNSTVAERTGTIKETTLQCLDGAGRLDTLPGFPQSVSNNTAPDSWLEMAGLNMDLYIDYLFRWHSTAFELMYYTPSGTGSNYPMTVIASDGESLFDQCAKLTGAIIPDYVLTCNRNGELKVLPEPQIQEIADRTATSQAAITASNILSINWDRTRPPRVHWNWEEAVKASGTVIDAFFTRAPGIAPGQGLSSQTTTFKLAKSQDDLNKSAGQRYAHLNAFHGHIVVTMATDGGIDPADMTWVTLTLASSYTRRVMGFSAARCLPIEINISYQYAQTGMVKSVELILEEETSGTPGVTYEPPETEWEWTPPPVIIPPPPTTEGTGFGTNYVLLLNILIRTRDLSALSPTWADISDSWADASDFILDPHNPSEIGLVLEEDGSLWKSTDLDEVSPTWSQVVVGGGIDAFKIIGSINVPNYFAYVYRDGDIYVKYTTDHWGIDNDVSIHAPDGEAHVEGAFDYVPHLGGSGVIMYVAIDEAGATQHQGVLVFRSIDSGATWAQTVNLGTTIGGNDLGDVQSMHVPYNDNPNGDIVYLGTSSGAGVGLYRSINGGTSFTNIVPGAGIAVVRQGVETWTYDRTRLYYWAGLTLNISTDNGLSFSTPAMNGFPSDGSVVASGGFPYQNSQYYAVVFGGTSEGIYVTIDGGENWQDKTGNAASLGIFAAGVESVQQRQAAIVPDWTE